MSGLTIIIPTINRPTLQRAVKSVLEQTVPCELIVVSDLRHSGAGPTRNRAIQSARTEWLGFLDDDDTLKPNYHQVMQENWDNYDLVVSRITLTHMGNDGLVPEPNITDPKDLRKGHVGMSFVVKTDLAKQYPFQNEFDYGQGEDWLFIDTLRNNGARIKLIPEVLYHVRPEDA